MDKKTKEIKAGFCCNCDKQIMDLKQRDPRKRKLPNYREHYFELNNGSLMKIAICEKCDESMDEKIAKNVMDRHYKTWKKEIEFSEIIPEEKKQQAIDYHLDLEVKKTGIDRVSFIKEKKNTGAVDFDKDRAEKEIQEKECFKNSEKAKKIAIDKKKNEEKIENEEKKKFQDNNEKLERENVEKLEKINNDIKIKEKEYLKEEEEKRLEKIKNDRIEFEKMASLNKEELKINSKLNGLGN